MFFTIKFLSKVTKTRILRKIIYSVFSNTQRIRTQPCCCLYKNPPIKTMKISQQLLLFFSLLASFCKKIAIFYIVLCKVCFTNQKNCIILQNVTLYPLLTYGNVFSKSCLHVGAHESPRSSRSDGLNRLELPINWHSWSPRCRSYIIPSSICQGTFRCAHASVSLHQLQQFLLPGTRCS